MYKVYIGEPLKGRTYLPLLFPNTGAKVKDSLLFTKNAFNFFNGPFVDITKNAGSADFFLVPHQYGYIEKEKEYIRKFSDLSIKYGKKLILFAYGDYDKDINLPNTIIFRTSRYRYNLKQNEIIMPSYAEDLGANNDFAVKTKEDKPSVGFCGKTDYKSMKEMILYKLINRWRMIRMTLSGDGKYNVYRNNGSIIRGDVLKILERSKLIKVKFIKRKTSSGHKDTISVDPETARKEFINNILDSDFPLAIKGEGNYSIRFYEILSLGRIPLFIDTDCILPLENIINYKKFVLFVDIKDIKNIEKIVIDYYNKLTPEEYENKQKMAREAFEKYLRIDKFFEIMFLKGGIEKYNK